MYILASRQFSNISFFDFFNFSTNQCANLDGNMHVLI